MSNLEKYIKEIRDSGLVISGTVLDDIKTNSDELTACIDTVNHHLEVDTNAINGVLMAANAGTNSDGVQRVCIADDDTNLYDIALCSENISNQSSAIKTNTDYLTTMNTTLTGIKTVTDGLAFGFPSGVASVNVQVRSLGGGNPISLGAGSTEAGTQRVTLSSGDVLTNDIKTLLTSIKNDLDYLVSVFTDVWEPGNHWIKTHAV